MSCYIEFCKSKVNGSKIIFSIVKHLYSMIKGKIQNEQKRLIRYSLTAFILTENNKYQYITCNINKYNIFETY